MKHECRFQAIHDRYREANDELRTAASAADDNLAALLELALKPGNVDRIGADLARALHDARREISLVQSWLARRPGEGGAA